MIENIVGLDEFVEMMKIFWSIWLVLYVLISWAFNQSVCWYHRLLYMLPVIKFLGTRQFRRGHRAGAIFGYDEGYTAGSKGKKMKQRKIERALKRAGI